MVMKTLPGGLAPSPCKGWGEGRTDDGRMALAGRTPTPTLPLAGGGSKSKTWTERTLALPHGRLVLRETAAQASGLPVLLLHGISSGAGSWSGLAAGLPGRHLLAWDAPGYGRSSALAAARPTAQDYAAVAQQALETLGLQRVLIVGHSLGAIVATTLAARLGPARAAGLLLLSPARGYGADAQRAAKVRSQRLQALQDKGVLGLAASVSLRLLSARATADHHAQVRQVAEAMTPGGYAQAVELLCGSDLPTLAAGLTPDLSVPTRWLACGSADVVTPPEACAALATTLAMPFTLLPGAGHAVAVEQADAVAALIAALLTTLITKQPTP